jgi:hypothetical protein
MRFVLNAVITAMALILLAAEFVVPSTALALILPSNQTPVQARTSVVAQSTSDDTAHWISPITPTPALDSACNGNVWIPYEDKEMFATALTSQVNKLTVEFFYDNAAPSKYLPGYNISSSCRLIAINIKHVP